MYTNNFSYRKEIGYVENENYCTHTSTGHVDTGACLLSFKDTLHVRPSYLERVDVGALACDVSGGQVVVLDHASVWIASGKSHLTSRDFRREISRLCQETRRCNEREMRAC